MFKLTDTVKRGTDHPKPFKRNATHPPVIEWRKHNSCSNQRKSYSEKIYNTVRKAKVRSFLFQFLLNHQKFHIIMILSINHINTISKCIIARYVVLTMSILDESCSFWPGSVNKSRRKEGTHIMMRRTVSGWLVIGNTQRGSAPRLGHPKIYDGEPDQH